MKKTLSYKIKRVGDISYPFAIVKGRASKHPEGSDSNLYDKKLSLFFFYGTMSGGRFAAPELEYLEENKKNLVRRLISHVGLL